MSARAAERSRRCGRSLRAEPCIDPADSAARPALTVYSVSEDRQSVRSLDKADLEGGIFADGGQIVRFRDPPDSISGLAVTRTALKAAFAALKDTQKPTR